MFDFFNREKFRRHGEVNDFVGVIRKFELERVELKTVTGAGASVDYTTDEAFGRKYAINGANRVRMTFDCKTASLAGGETITATLYHRKKDSDDFFIVGTITGVVPAVTVSSNKVRGSVEFSDASGLLKKATHIAITGATITVANTCVCDFGLEMWNEDEISVAGDGLATEATLAAMNAKVPAQGQALAAASTPVVLPALQQAALENAASSSKQETLVAANTTLAVGTYYNGNAAVTWTRLGTYDVNGKAMRGFSVHGLATVPDNAGDSVTVTVYGSNDPNATAGSKQAHQSGFYDDRVTVMSMVTSIVIPRNTAGEIAILCPDFGYEWVYIKEVVAGHDATGCSLFLNTFK